MPRDSIELVTNIGYGTMGPVWKAKAWDIRDSEDATSVAIKTLNGKSYDLFHFMYYSNW